MKKTRILATCLAAAAMGAQAQSNVQLNGLVDAYVGSMRLAGDASSKTTVGSGGMTTSWWGMSGSEDLGGGLKASFALNGFFRTDTGEAGRFGPGDTQFSRDAYVSLSGGFGALALGRGKAPNFLPTIAFNPMGDSFTFSPLVLHASNNRTLTGGNWVASNPSDTGWSNQITYTTPSMAGLKANLHYQPGEVATENGKKNIGFNLMYAAGPLGLTAFWEKDQVKNPVPDVLDLGATRTNWMLGGSYDATVVKGFMTYGKSTSDLATVADKKTLSLGLSAPVGGGKVLAAYAQSKVDQGPTRDTVTVGYDYNLSKRTDLYAMLMNDKITNFDSGNSVGLGVRHRF